jgi:uncharacterized protein (TIGR02118 family)
MIRVSVLYPRRDGARFDIDYYCQRHVPLVQGLVGAAIKGVSVDHGLAGIAPGAPAPMLAMAHFLFDSVDAFQSAFGQHAGQILADVPNYTSIEPVFVVSEVRIG